MSSHLPPRDLLCDLAKPRAVLQDIERGHDDAHHRNQDASALDAPDNAQHPAASVLQSSQMCGEKFRNAERIEHFAHCCFSPVPHARVSSCALYASEHNKIFFYAAPEFFRSSLPLHCQSVAHTGVHRGANCTGLTQINTSNFVGSGATPANETAAIAYSPLPAMAANSFGPNNPAHHQEQHSHSGQVEQFAHGGFA